MSLTNMLTSDLHFVLHKRLIGAGMSIYGEIQMPDSLWSCFEDYPDLLNVHT